MSLCIPQTALDSTLCDSCHKYLSVTPVKVFPNRRIKCGRCISEEDDNGIISMYNNVAIKSIFKCINHYEGCKALLKTSEVLEHEKTCESEKYECPNCNEAVLSYYMYKHFTNKHKELVLKKPYFVNNDSEGLVHFLYCYKDYMIFVKYSYNNCTNNALFKFSLLNSKFDETLKINVVITSGNIVKEKEMDCDIFPLDAGNDFKVQLDLKKYILVVSFSLKEPNSNVEIPIAVDKGPSDLISMKLQDLYFREKETVELLNSSTKKVKEIKRCDMVFACFRCSLTFYKDRSNDDYYDVVYRCGRYYLTCPMCKRVHNQNLGPYFMVHYSYVESTSYFCKWKCGTNVDLEDLQTHEGECDSQISQPCPVELCYHSCRLFEIEEHLEEHHPNLKSPVFHNSHFSSDLCYADGESLELDPSASPLKVIYIVSHIYIGIELIYDKPLWKISLTCKISNVRPRMIILDDDCAFVTVIKERGSCPQFEQITYKCYLADPKKELYE